MASSVSCWRRWDSFEASFLALNTCAVLLACLLRQEPADAAALKSRLGRGDEENMKGVW